VRILQSGQQKWAQLIFSLQKYMTTNFYKCVFGVIASHSIDLLG